MSETNAFSVLDWKVALPVAGPGWGYVRWCDKFDLRSTIRLLEKHGATDQAEVLKRLRKALVRYERLYGANVVEDIPAHAIETAMGKKRGSPARRRGYSYGTKPR